MPITEPAPVIRHPQTTPHAPCDVLLLGGATEARTRCEALLRDAGLTVLPVSLPAAVDALRAAHRPRVVLALRDGDDPFLDACLDSAVRAGDAPTLVVETAAPGEDRDPGRSGRDGVTEFRLDRPAALLARVRRAVRGERRVRAAATVRDGHTGLPHLTVLRELAVGNEAELLLAEAGDASRPVVLKVLRPDRDGDPSARARLRREARALRHVQTPGVPRLRHYGTWRGRPALTMEWMPGRCLGAAQVREVAPALVAGLGRALWHILTAVHGAGYVHRDVKPANILVADDGRVSLVDFGLAWHAGLRRVTQLGHVVGTPGYIAPELVVGPGLPAQAVDLYGLGATLYRELTGRRPGAELPELVRARRATRVGHGDDPRAVRADVPAPLARAVALLTHADPHERMRTAPEAYRLLQAGHGD